jgi:hypothetical protein
VLILAAIHHSAAVIFTTQISLITYRDEFSGLVHFAERCVRASNYAQRQLICLLLPTK